MSRIVRVSFEALLPMLPNFLRNGHGETMDIADCTDEGLRGLGREWTEALVAHAHKRRANRDSTGTGAG